MAAVLDGAWVGDVSTRPYASAHQYGDSFEKINQRLIAGEYQVFSKPWLLTIDLDSEEELAVFQVRLESFKTTIGYDQWFSIKSPSGRGYHVYVLLKSDYGVAERISMQTALGSDPIRELLSIYKFVKGERTGTEDDHFDNPSWLFEKDLSTLPPWTKPDWVRPKDGLDKTSPM